MKLRKAVAFLVLAATVAGCASPQMVTRESAFQTQGIDMVKLTAVSGTYR